MASNRLADAASSYLRSAAHQPTDWHTWGPEAFELAKREDKPILLDIGAVWCHWCHVMDRESYEDEEVARILNERYVPVKVDRDERPDVDARYQRALQAMQGQGGWPLTLFLTPDGRPFFGGTYFPPVDRQGLPGFKRVLEAVAEAYVKQREDIEKNATHLIEHLAAHAPGAPTETPVDDELLDAAVAHVRQAHDPEWGGFGRAPKFPHPAAHDFLLARAARGDAAARDLVLTTLDRMREGGIYDQLAGGYHRYSVDREWHVPHFEKMLYDNAPLLRNHSRAGAAFGRAHDVETADEIARWMRDVLAQDGKPGFGGSQDADVGLDDDGDYFTWTPAELRDAVQDDDLAKLLEHHYGVREQGDMHHDPAKNVLRVEADAEAIAAALHRGVEEVRARLDEGKRRLREARAKREAPFVDPIRYSSWNGMAIQALLEHGGRTGSAEWDALALRALDAFLDTAFDPERGFARTLAGGTYGLLDDNAQMLDALLEAHLATGRARYLDAARATADLLLARFAHPSGGFADRGEGLAPEPESAPLALRQRPVEDAPTASPNGVALRALLRLSDASGEARYRGAAGDSLAMMADEARHLGVFGGALLLALENVVHPPPRVEVKGDAAPYRALVRRHAPPGAVLVEGGENAAALPRDGAVVCLGTRCLAPAHSADELQARLDEARR